MCVSFFCFDNVIRDYDQKVYQLKTLKEIRWVLCNVQLTIVNSELVDKDGIR